MVAVPPAMSTTNGPDARTWTTRTRLGGLLVGVGVALVGYGNYVHLTVGDRTLGHCDGCDPWHPPFVVAPLVAGATLALAGSSLLAMR